MRVLVVSPIFPPISNAEANVTAKWVNALIEAGVETAVIHSSDLWTDSPTDHSRMWAPAIAVSHDLSSRRSTSIFHRMGTAVRYRSTSWSSWTGNVVRKAAALHALRPFDMVVSRALPRHGHLAGFWTARRLKIPWIAVTNDPWDISPFVADPKFRRAWTLDRSSRRWWLNVLHRADALCFPCERLRDYCLGREPRGNNVWILPHIGATRAAPKRPGGFVLVHAGRLGTSELTGRSSIPLMTAVSRLFSARPQARTVTRLVFVGPPDVDADQFAARTGMQGSVYTTGLVDYETSLEYIDSATVCLLSEGSFKEGIFLPSKLCDYLVAGKPVLALSPRVGTVSDLSRLGGIHVADSPDPETPGRALVRLFDAHVDGTIEALSPPPDLRRRFESGTVASDFVARVATLPAFFRSTGAR